MHSYEHSVHLDVEKCTGCTTCLRRCPTEAIRIRDDHAVINETRCIDCGECIRVCPHRAKKAESGKLEDIWKFKYTVALPPPSLYGQFDNLDDADFVLQGLRQIGFDDVVEVAQAAEWVSAYTRQYLKTEGISKPVISSACPAVVRLICLRFPSLKGHIMQMLPPMEVAARKAREKALAEHPELRPEDIGVCFISPCPAKVSYIKNGFADYKSQVDVVVSASDMYFQLINAMSRDNVGDVTSKAGVIGISWASSGGEASALYNDEYLAVDGIENVCHLLDQIENGNIPPVDFIELNACTGGCVGGVMNVENPYMAKARLQNLRRYLPVSQNTLSKTELQYIPDNFFFDKFPTYQPIFRLSSSIAESMRMMSDIQEMRKRLPGIDCGACGAPTCRAYAEDVIKGTAGSEMCRLCVNGGLKAEEEADDC